MRKWLFDFLVDAYEKGKEITPFFLDIELGYTYSKAVKIIREFDREYMEKNPRKPIDEDPFLD